jgi:hypothetical protein
VRTTLVAVHQANVTGNYTVLRDLGAPGFREKNSAADLARIFAPIREQRIDLGAVVLLNPQLSQVQVNTQKMLHIVGTLATKPVPVNFELLFQAVNGVWQVNGIAVSPAPQSAAPAPAPAKPTGNQRAPKSQR